MKFLLNHYRRFSERAPRLAKWTSTLVVLVLVTGLIKLITVQLTGHSFSWVHDVLATNDKQPGAVDNTLTGVGTIIAGLATLFIKLIGGILYFILRWMGSLMDNTFILEGEIGEKIRAVWVIVRNFVNIFFALSLVVVALLSVIGYGDESGNLAMKKFIPKMALALIAVNFTFLACRLVLDVNNVLTTAIFSIPQRVTTIGDIAGSSVGSQTIFRKFQCFGDEDPQKAANDAEALSKRFNGTLASLGGVCFALNPDEVRNQSSTDYNEISDPAWNKAHPNEQGIITLDSSRFYKKRFCLGYGNPISGTS